MKRSKILLFMLIILLVPSLTGCSSPSAQLRNTFSVYLDVISEDIPEDMQLTIYYIDPLILTRRALSTDDLVKDDDVKKIVVEHEELSTQLALLSKLEPSILEPVKEETYLDARLYYVIETETHGKILEVAVSEIGRNVFVNGIAVEHNSVFYEVIIPFLSVEDIAILGRRFDGTIVDFLEKYISTGDGSLS